MMSECVGAVLGTTTREKSVKTSEMKHVPMPVDGVASLLPNKVLLMRVELSHQC